VWAGEVREESASPAFGFAGAVLLGNMLPVGSPAWACGSPSIRRPSPLSRRRWRAALVVDP